MNCLNALSRALLVLTACVFVGCTGGDGLGELTLTAQNIEDVSGQALGANDLLGDMGDLVDDMADVIDNPSSQVIPCSSGNLNMQINDVAPQGQLSTGDSASFTFNGCVVDVGGTPLTLNGTLTFTADEVTGSEGGPFTLTLSANFQSLSVVGFGATLVINGGFTHALSSADGQNLVSVISGTSFSAFAQGPGGQVFSGTVTNFRYERQYNDTTGAYLWDLDATVSGSEFNGMVTYETTVPFTGTDPDYPDAGTLVIRGADGGVATVFAVDNTNVRIELDADGDGTPEVTINTTWAVVDDSAP